MTFKKELIELFKSPVDDEWYPSWAQAAFFHNLSEEDQPDGVVLGQVDEFGGEGQRDQYWTVYKFTKGDEELYVKFYGWYASYDGATYEGYQFVQPKQKVVTVYE